MLGCALGDVLVPRAVETVAPDSVSRSELRVERVRSRPARHARVKGCFDHGDVRDVGVIIERERA